MGKGIWIFAERSDGTVRKVTLEMLSEARKIADAIGEELCVVILGEGVEAVEPELVQERVRMRKQTRIRKRTRWPQPPDPSP